MVESLQYMIDENGKTTSVLVPVEMWTLLNENYRKLQNKMAVFSGIQQGLDEVKKAQRNGKPLQTLKDFLT